jgi:hypothetical protein
MNYRLCDVKIVCERIYGYSINPRTWIRWKNFLAISPRLKEINFDEMCRLLTYAKMKREKPYKQFTLLDVMQSKGDFLKEMKDVNRNEKMFIPAMCKGKDLPSLIKSLTGRELSLRAMYRISEKVNMNYRINSLYTKNDIERLISVI